MLYRMRNCCLLSLHIAISRLLHLVMLYEHNSDDDDDELLLKNKKEEV